MKAESIVNLHATGDLRRQLPEIFVVRMNELWELSRHIQFEDRVSELHDMRIAAKRLRYCFEFFTPLFGVSFAAHLKEFKRLQDYLGEIHDCDVWVDYLRAELKLAMKQLSKPRRKLDKFTGASPELADAAREFEERYRNGPVSGLLKMISELCQRRRTLYQELQQFWNGLEECGFQQSLARDVADAARYADDAADRDNQTEDPK